MIEDEQIGSKVNWVEVRREPPELCIVVPCYNEEQVLRQTAAVLSGKVRSLVDTGEIKPSSAVLLVDDGSADGTWSIIEQLHDEDTGLFHGVKFSHNQGHQNAVYAGLMAAYDRGCDAAVSLDADLQDDPDAIDEMVRDYRDGNEIVFGVRNNRDTDSMFKRSTAEAFYTLMSWMGADIIPDHADYRLMSRTAIEALSRYTETNLFLRGIVPSLGFSTSEVFYKRGTRAAGESKYPVSKMLSFAMEGITSFSVKPLRIITMIGMLSIVVGIVMLVYTVVSVCSGNAVTGWGSLMVSMWLLGGLILVSLGVVGEYIGRIYLETKRRPRYIIERMV
ncbi:glycosyltransferase [Bifidobacterium ramosum]|uniref:Glycosyltransferase n=1 Tax=Bifidobacterium ramosum TaxID=1798158 RepID=A0A6L4X1U1_9BIFI|nr:glycosyltransferase family 2 protein [Bifidobacterium ramosum]KAB8288602.1 glycosyltransferase [Bifidobacterium ramosum]NEG71805.1 glycosyltransferase [Bifidobacterium ramosum]